MNKHHRTLIVAVFGLFLALSTFGVALARDTYIKNNERAIRGCGTNTAGDEICLTINGTLVNAQNGSSHKAFVVAEGTPVNLMVNGVPAERGNLFCTAKQGKGNGTLKVRGNVQKAGKQGGGIFVQANSAGKLTCTGLDATFDVYKNASTAGVRPINADVKHISGCGENNAGEAVCVTISGMTFSAQSGSDHKAFFVAEGTQAVTTINDVNIERGNLFCTAKQGTGNGTLKVRGKVDKAGKQGGGLFVQAESAGKLMCEGRNGPAKGAMFEVK